MTLDPDPPTAFRRKIKVGKNAKISYTEVDEDRDMKVGIQPKIAQTNRKIVD